MIPELSPDLRHALQAAGAQPLRLLDPDTQTEYVLLPADVYERKVGGDADDDLAATYRAQIESAAAAGWDEPAMSDYDNYDENRRKQCP